jgi:hypothetical protein
MGLRLLDATNARRIRRKRGELRAVRARVLALAFFLAGRAFWDDDCANEAGVISEKQPADAMARRVNMTIIRRGLTARRFKLLS